MTDLSKKYKNLLALDEINLSLKSGKIFGLLGPNGAGKSTMIKILTTLLEPTKGTLQILEKDAVKDSLAIRKRIGVVLQQPSYEPNLTVEKALDKYGMMWDVPTKIRKDRVNEIILEFDLNDIRKKKNDDLSIGQRRRVQVAREFIHDMDILFLDEPTVGLDPSARKKLLNFVKKKAEMGLTIFYTTHIMSEVEYLCDEIIVLNKGKIIAMDTPDKLKNKFDNQKQIKIYVQTKIEQIDDIVNVKNAKIKKTQDGFVITISTTNVEDLLIKILEILKNNNIKIVDLTILPVSLEDVFLKIVGDTNASNN